MGESVGVRLIYKGFEAWIDVDDEPLPHFGMEHNDPTNEARAWIPSEAGKRFTVCYRNTLHDENGYRALLYLDGQAFGEAYYGEHLLRTRKMARLLVSPTEVRAFVFNHAALTDDDAVLDTPTSAGAGDIKLVLQRARPRDAPPKRKRFRDVPSAAQKIHERAKKGLVHQIQFSERQPRFSKRQPVHGEDRTRVKVRTKPVGDPVTFIFRYRSLDVLQASGIAPCPAAPAKPEADDTGSSHSPEASVGKSEEEDAKPEPGPSHVSKQEDEDEDEEDELADDDEDDEIVKREQALMAELEEVRKQKRARQEMRRSASRVKTEPVINLRPGEVLDLTAEPEIVRPKNRVKTESTSRKFIHGMVIDLT